MGNLFFSLLLLLSTVDKVYLSVMAGNPQKLSGVSKVVIFMSASSTRGVLTSITWDCGNGNAPIVENFFHNPAGAGLTITGVKASKDGKECLYKPGTYTPKVSVSDSVGKTKTASVTITI
jgi:hypothetical protein